MHEYEVVLPKTGRTILVIDNKPKTEPVYEYGAFAQKKRKNTSTTNALQPPWLRNTREKPE